MGHICRWIQQGSGGDVSVGGEERWRCCVCVRTQDIDGKVTPSIQKEE